MPLPAILPLLAQSGLATYMLREPAYNAIGSYVQGNHPKLDPYLLPAMSAYMKADQAMFGGLDKAGKKLTNRAILHAIELARKQTPKAR